jgi:hypothetical protein
MRAFDKPKKNFKKTSNSQYQDDDCSEFGYGVKKNKYKKSERQRANKEILKRLDSHTD